MPIVGQHEKRIKKIRTPDRIVQAVMLTYERPGLLMATVESFHKATPYIHLTIYDDGSTSEEKLRELDLVEAMGFQIHREPHRGLVRTWRKVFYDFYDIYN